MNVQRNPPLGSLLKFVAANLTEIGKLDFENVF